MSDLIKRLVGLVCIAALVLVGWKCWCVLSPSAPKDSNDPFGIGYPNGPDKPAALRMAEDAVIDQWVKLQNAKVDNPRRQHDELILASIEEFGAFRSASEKRKYLECSYACVMFSIAMALQGHSEIQDERVRQYIMKDYLKDTLGIRIYSRNSAGDRAVLEQSGVAVRQVDGRWRVLEDVP